MAFDPSIAIPGAWTGTTSPRADPIRLPLGDPLQPGLVFELLVQQTPSQRVPRAAANGASHGSSVSAGAPPPARGSRPASRGDGGGSHRGGGTLPVRGFDMATGTVQAGQPASSEGSQGTAAPWEMFGMGEAPNPLTAAAAVTLRPLGSACTAAAAAAAAAPPPPSRPSVTAAYDAERDLVPRGYATRPLEKALTGGTRGGRSWPGRHASSTAEAEAEARRTAWDASQLDLSDVMARGPLNVRSLFAPSATQCSAACGGVPLCSGVRGGAIGGGAIGGGATGGYARGVGGAGGGRCEGARMASMEAMRRPLVAEAAGVKGGGGAEVAQLRLGAPSNPRPATRTSRFHARS